MIITPAFRKQGQKSIAAFVRSLLTPLPSFTRFAAAFAIGLITLGITASVLAFNKPAVVTSSYEVLEPKTWVGKELPILEYIDVGEKLKEGNWLVLFYHYDCPDCIETIPKYEQLARDLTSNEDFLKIAFIEVPPYGRPINQNSPCTFGRLADVKEWFVTTPAVALLTNGRVKSAWEEKAPDFDTIIQKMAKNRERFTNISFCSSTDSILNSLIERR